MKKQNILISLLAIFALVGCTNSNSKSDKTSNQVAPSSAEGGNSSEPAPGPQPAETPTFKIEGFSTARFEAEQFNTENWEFDPSYDAAIVEDENASGGKYLAAGDPSYDGAYCEFNFEITAEYVHFVFAAAYAQTDENKAIALDMSKVYTYEIESVNSLRLGDSSKTLKARSSATDWEVITYEEEDLYAGTYKVKLIINEDVPEGGCPSIDYIQLKTTNAKAPDVDPSTITSVPDNDMRNLQQYKFLQETDLTKYKTYANGNDLSAPEGIKLRFEDVETASKYYVQVAESEAALASATVREATEKVYKFQNAKLGTKYYYRAATSEAALASATVKNITTTDVAPRVCYVPDVLNFRDIGGWDSSLVANGKIKQGLYFRCAQLNGAAGSTTSKLDSAGKGLAALKELGIKVDIDMRDKANQPSNGVSPANTADWPFTFVSAAVPSGSEPVRWEGGTYQGTNIAQQYVTIFNALANCDTAPALLHCTYGADRTGIVTFFLEALLGMSEEDMTRDYLWTQFTKGRNVKLLASEGSEWPQWIEKTNGCAGATFADKMENHLESFGIAHATLEHIREIFVEGYVAK